MITLVIPDVHEQTARLLSILSHYESRVDRVVCLGDYFDSYAHDVANVESMCKWLNLAAQNPKFTLLMGNHDLQYFYPGFTCSGYHLDTRLAIEQGLDATTRASFKTHTWVGDDILCSHAGLTTRWYDAKPDTLSLQDWLARCESSFLRREWLGTTYNFARDLITAAGSARGGYASAVGGLLWCDWNYEFAPIPNVRQIVGHTFTGSYVTDGRGRTRFRRGEPGVKGTNWNIDTGLFHVALITDGAVRIHPWPH